MGLLVTRGAGPAAPWQAAHQLGTEQQPRPPLHLPLFPTTCLLPLPLLPHHLPAAPLPLLPHHLPLPLPLLPHNLPAAGWFNPDFAFGVQRGLNPPGKSPPFCSEF